MKSTILTLSALVLLFVLASCSNAKKQADATASTETEAVLDVDALLANAGTMIGQQVTVQGVCTHTCKHGATKIFLQGSDNSQVLRCEAGQLGAFSKDCVNNVVRVTGLVRETRMDEAYLQNWKRQYEEAMQQQQNAADAQFGEQAEALSEEQQEKLGSSAGCATESAARREVGNTIDEKIANYRAQIAARQAAEGKDYLSFYHVEAVSYQIVANE